MNIANLNNIKRKSVDFELKKLITTDFLNSDKQPPLVIQPAIRGTKFNKLGC